MCDSESKDADANASSPHRPATNEWLESGVPHVKIPAAGSPGKIGEDRAFYFAILLYHRPHGVPTSRGSQGSGSLDDDSAEAQQPTIAGVTLGPLLGKGSFGTCYIGQWHGEKVAVKVISQNVVSSLTCPLVAKRTGRLASIHARALR